MSTQQPDPGKDGTTQTDQPQTAAPASPSYEDIPVVAPGDAPEAAAERISADDVDRLAEGHQTSDGDPADQPEGEEGLRLNKRRRWYDPEHSDEVKQPSEVGG